jgi:hypothetical protein
MGEWQPLVWSAGALEDNVDTEWDNNDTTVSISSRVVVRPRLKRIAPMPISGEIFIAFKTGDNSTDPE